MILIFTLDDMNATNLMGKRQSRDQALADKILAITENKLYLKEQSLSFFNQCNSSHPLHVISEFTEAPADAYIFAEEPVSPELMDAADKIYVFRWNRIYPSLVKDRVNLQNYRYDVVCDLHGTTHHKITWEVYYK